MRRPYVTRRHLEQLERSLSERDRAILVTLRRVRAARSDQLERLHAADVTLRQARQCLRSLADRRLVGRLPRRVGGVRAGSAGFVYTLDVAGQRLVAPGKRAQVAWPVGSLFLDHTLAVTELYVRLVEAERAGRLRLASFAAEPATWRSFVGPGGGRVVLKPDAEVTVAIGRYEDRWFVEVDRGTESTTTLSRKCALYMQYWQSGAEQAGHEVFPRVLWLVPHERRQEQVVGVLGRLPAESWPLFTVARFDGAVARMVQGAGV
jgi:Replication-relaxation